MFGSVLSKWWQSPVGALTRLEGLALRGWLSEVRKDIRFAGSILVIFGFAIAAIVKATSMLSAMPLAGIAAALVAGLVVFRSSYISPGSPRWRQLSAGILHPWTAFGPALGQWVFWRAAVLSLITIVAITAIVLVTNWHVALACLAAMSTGAVLGAATTCLSFPVTFKIARLRLAPRLGRRLNLPPAVQVSLAATFRRKAGIVPVWMLTGGLWALATPASALADHNNPEMPIGFAIITITGLVCAIAFAWPNLRLVRFLAFQPIPVRRIITAVCGPQVMLAGLLAVIAAFGAGQPIPMALVSAAVVVGGLCFWLNLLIPYAMTRSVGMAPVMAMSELFVAAIVKFALQFGMLAAGWLIVRSVANMRAINRKRWKEPS